MSSSASTDPASPNALALLDTDIDTVIAQSKKALHVIHTIAAVDPAARRAFLLCDGVMRKLAPALKIDLRDWPRVEALGGGMFGQCERGGEGEQEGQGEVENDDKREGNSGSDSDSGGRMEVEVEGLEDLVDFDGDAG